MSSIAIKAEGLSKSYLVGHESGSAHQYHALRDTLSRGAAGLARRTRDLLLGRPLIDGDVTEEFWALKDLSFEIKRGDRVGVIGRNGAGKSTLLKILSRITEPTKGRATIDGRVASLLEVGTGFHPELTGRENIFLNGAVLGMKRTEVQERFDAIVDFSGVERFLDTPVKRYSSGMYVRLAFAVAAHLEPEILIIDEVLAVGDAQFQKKCIGKMQEVGQGGRTVLFVSHNMVAVEGLCTRAMLVEGGTLIFDGSVPEALERYRGSLESLATGPLEDRRDRKGTGRVRFRAFKAIVEGEPSSGTVIVGKRVKFEITYEATAEARDVEIALNLYSREDDVLINFNSADRGREFALQPGTGTFVCSVPFFPLRAGTYMGNLYCTVGGDVADWIKQGFRIEVEDGDVHGSGRLISQGRIVCPYEWDVRPEQK